MKQLQLMLFSLTVFAYLAVKIIYYQDNMIFDLPIIDFIQAEIAPYYTYFFRFITKLGSFKAFLIISLFTGILLLWKRYYHLAIWLGTTMISCGILNQLFKFIFERPRPEFWRLAHASGFSFPSGHAMGSICLYLLLLFILKQLALPQQLYQTVRFIFLSLIILIGISRVYLGVHYPSDVLAGYLVGFFWFNLAILIYQRSCNSSSRNADITVN